LDQQKLWHKLDLFAFLLGGAKISRPFVILRFVRTSHLARLICILPSHPNFAHYATGSDGNSDGPSVRISSIDSVVPVSAGRKTIDEKQAQHFRQSQT
jgi:hypothetical protein